MVSGGAAQQICEGVRVVLIRLERDEFNGRCGTVHRYILESERYFVHMDTGPGANVKYDNLQVVTQSVTSGPTELSHCSEGSAKPDIFTRVGIRINGHIDLLIIPIYDSAAIGIVQWLSTSSNDNEVECTLCAQGKCKLRELGKSKPFRSLANM